MNFKIAKNRMSRQYAVKKALTKLNIVLMCREIRIMKFIALLIITKNEFNSQLKV